MTPVERVAEHSRDQHHRYYTLFGSDPVNGDGFSELHTSIRELGQHATDVHTQLAQSGFTSAADAGIAAATRDDHLAFGDAAAIAAAAAAAVDTSAQINTRGAAAIAAHMDGEAALLSVIPDKASPDAVMQALATIDHHQAKSLSTVEQLASTAQDLGQAALAGRIDTAPPPVSLSQMPDSHHLPSLAQPESHSGLTQLAQPLTATPAPAEAPEQPADPSNDPQIGSAASESVLNAARSSSPVDESDDEPDLFTPNSGTSGTAGRLHPRIGPHR